MSPGTFFLRIVAFLRGTITRMIAWISRLGWLKASLGALAIGAVILVGAHFFLGSTATVVPAVQAPLVQVRSVADLSADAVPLSVAGTVTSRSEATVRAQKSAQIIRLSYAL